MTVSAILKAKGGQVVTVPPETTVAQAIEELSGRQIGAVVVADGDGKLLGIFSERDLVRGLAEAGPSFLDGELGACMASPVVTCGLDDSEREVMALMTDRRFRHLPVVDDGKLVGIVSIGDVVKSRIDAALAEADALRDYIIRG